MKPLIWKLDTSPTLDTTMSLISQNIMNYYSFEEDGEMSFLFGRFADAHPGESLFVFNAFYTALQNGEVNCYLEECDHSSCPIWEYFNEWFITPMLERMRQENGNEYQDLVQRSQQSRSFEFRFIEFHFRLMAKHRWVLDIFRLIIDMGYDEQTALNMMIDWWMLRKLLEY